jgi:hypothetical protein
MKRTGKDVGMNAPAFTYKDWRKPCKDVRITNTGPKLITVLPISKYHPLSLYKAIWTSPLITILSRDGINISVWRVPLRAVGPLPCRGERACVSLWSWERYLWGLKPLACLTKHIRPKGRQQTKMGPNRLSRSIRWQPPPLD